jgi:pyoverdine/dityrosine biosynthesis protein Dit1
MVKTFYTTMTVQEAFVETRAETNTKNQYSNIRDYYSIRIRIFVDVIFNIKDL